MATDSALVFAARAAELSDAAADRAAALAITGEARYQRGEGDDAFVAWREAVRLLEHDPSADRALTATLCGRLAMLTTRAPGLMPNTVADADDIAGVLALGRAAAGDGDSPALVDMLMAEGAWGFGFPSSGDDADAVIERMTEAARQAVAMAERLGSPELVSLALDVAYITEQRRDDVQAMVAGVERRVQLADGIHAGIDLDDIFYMAAQAYWEQGRYREALAATEQGEARVTAIGADAIGSESTSAITRMLMGDWDAVIDQYHVITARWDQPPGFLRMVYAVAESVFAMRGDREAAERIREVQFGTIGRLAFRARGLLAEGRIDEALAQIPQSLHPDGICFGMQVEAELLRAAERWDDLAAHCRSVRERSQRIGWVLGPAVADRAEAALAMVGGDAAAAEPLLQRSVAGFRAAGAEWDAAVSMLDLAAALQALGRDGEAAAQLDAATPALERAGGLVQLQQLALLRRG